MQQRVESKSRLAQYCSVKDLGAKEQPKKITKAVGNKSNKKHTLSKQNGTSTSKLRTLSKHNKNN
jgi:hypothetical protein